MNNLVAKLAVTASVTAGLLLTCVSGAQAVPAVPAAPAEGPLPLDLDLDLPMLVCGIGISLLGDATAACPAAAPSGGAHAATAATTADASADWSAEALVDLVAALRAAGHDDLADALETAAGERDDLATTADVATAATADVAAADDLVAADAAGPITVCGLAVALLGDAVGACPEGPAAPAGPALGLDVPGVGTLNPTNHPAAAPSGQDSVLTVTSDGPITVCGIAVGVVKDATGACPG